MKQMLKTRLAMILVLLLLMALGTLSVSAADVTEVAMHNCDTTAGWSVAGGTPTISTSEKTEGKGSLEWSVTGSFWVTRKWDTPIDAGDANTLVFDLYISSVTDFFEAGTSEFALELTSAGIYDDEETAFSLTTLDLEDGWNRVELELFSSGCDYSRINYIRIYTLGTDSAQPLTFRLDNFHLAKLEKGAVDLGDQTLGNTDDQAAVPPIKDIAVNTPYDPWSSADAVQPPTEQPAEPTASPVAVVLLAVGGAALVAAILLFLLLKKHRLLAAALAAGLALILAVSGLCVLLLGPQPEDPTTPSTTLQNPFFTTDQTGHPEVSGPQVDVEALLRVNPSYSTKKDYEIHYVSSLPVMDISGLPRVTLHEAGANTQGLSIAFGTEEPLRYLNYSNVDCWVLDSWKKTNTFTLSADAATRRAWNGRDAALNFRIHLSQDATLIVAYVDTAGNEVTVEAKCERRTEWTDAHVNLSDLALTGALAGGADLKITVEGPEITRLHAVYLSEPAAESEPQTGLIHSKFDTSSTIVADANVLAFGATGNGYTDDTQAFADAIAYVESLGGGTVFVPAGYYCLTSTLSLPVGVGLVGELEMGTARGTVLCIYGGKGSTDPDRAAVLLNHQSAVMNVAFWYPEQTFVNGTPIPYPPTITQIGSESVTVRNVTFVNAYFGIHFGARDNNSLQYVRDIYGTCLEVGYYNNNSYDIGRFENVLFTPDAWLSSGLPGTPNATLLRTYMLRNSTGMWMQRIDWTYYADITIEGYHIGMLYNSSSAGTSNGHSYNIDLLDCYYGIYAEELSWLMLTNATIRATGGEGATAIYLGENSHGSLSLSHCTLSSTGTNAMVNLGGGAVSMTACTLSSASDSTYVNVLKSDEVLLDTTLSGNAGNHALLTTTDAPSLLTSVDYGKTIITKPASDAFIHMGEEYGIKKEDDITAALKDAIAKLGVGGGTIYIPAGSYTVSEPITVTAGIELRGATAWTQNGTGTVIHTQVGRNDPDGEALFTLYDGAGLRGLSIWYVAQNYAALEPYSYTVRGRGKGIYIVACAMPTSWRGVDFSTYRCDEHYVEYLWGAFLEVGISVGSGSRDGIIRDCQFTPNSWPLRPDENWWYQVYEPIMEQSRPWIIGESEGQILYHNFTYGAREGLSVCDGAKDVFVIGHGVDSGYTSAHFSGDCSVYMVNTQLVNLYQKKSGVTMNYLVTDESFTGTLDLINSAYWGSSTSAMVLKGDGEVRLYAALMHNAGAPMCEMSGGTLKIWGMINATRTRDFLLHRGAQALTLTGNIFRGGVQITEDADADVILDGTDIEQ